MSRTDNAAAYFAGRCRSLLRERASGDGITVEMLVWDNDHFAVAAFHTAHHFDDDRFVREYVEYSTYDQSDSVWDELTFGVRHYHTGHHEEFIDYDLEEIEE